MTDLLTRPVTDSFAFRMLGVSIEMSGADALVWGFRLAVVVVSASVVIVLIRSITARRK